MRRVHRVLTVILTGSILSSRTQIHPIRLLLLLFALLLPLLVMWVILKPSFLSYVVCNRELQNVFSWIKLVRKTCIVIHSSSKETQLFLIHFSWWPWARVSNQEYYQNKNLPHKLLIYSLLQKNATFKSCVSFEEGCSYWVYFLTALWFSLYYRKVLENPHIFLSQQSHAFDLMTVAF